jgi:undecaprenyl-diphosphatase
LEFLQNIDVAVFYFINNTLANPVTDSFMPFITEVKNWIIFYVVVWFYMVIRGGRKGIVAGILILVCILFSDQLSSNLLKNYFQRIRPCNALPHVHLLVDCTRSFAFPSSHAVNNFAAATLFSYFYPRFKYVLFIGAFLVAISRVSCGVHYPFDMLGGIVIGILVGLFIIYLWKVINSKFKILKE